MECTETRPATEWPILRTIRARRRAAANWNASATEAQPGKIWTASYRAKRAVFGGHYESWTAGPVRILGTECPVEAFRGEKTLGEHTLSGRPLPLGWLTYPATNYRLTRGDVAPTVRSGADADLLAVPPGRMVTVEHRSDHPVYAGLRFVEIGRAGRVTDFGYDEGHEDGPGRYVGDTWVRLSEVTGVQW